MKKTILAAMLLSTVMITGCERAKEELGLTRRTPDEFAVLQTAPLEIPSNLDQVTALPVPRLGADRPQELNPSQAAQSIILGTSNATNTAPSGIEASILEQAGATSASADIRKTVDREAYENADKNRPVVKRIMNWGNKRDPGAAVIVDAPAEAARIKANKSGETPYIQD